jgi:hypothetical protein
LAKYMIMVIIDGAQRLFRHGYLNILCYSAPKHYRHCAAETWEQTEKL